VLILQNGERFPECGKGGNERKNTRQEIIRNRKQYDRKYTNNGEHRAAKRWVFERNNKIDQEKGIENINC
jgi:hypothetical protein